MENISDRVRALRKSLALSQEKLGKLAGVSKAAVSQWELGITKPERDALLALQKNKGVNTFWLATGDGEMFLEDGVVNIQPPDEAFPPSGKFTPEQAEAFRFALKGIDLFETTFDTKMEFDDKNRLFLLLANSYWKRIKRGDAPLGDEEILDDVVNIENYRKTGG